MSNVSTTMKRLSAAVLSACLLALGAPLLAATPASAAVPSGQARINFFAGVESQGQYTDISSRYDGYDSNMKISAIPTLPGPGFAPISYVTFTATRGNPGVTQQIGTAYTQPFEILANFPEYVNSSVTNAASVTVAAYDADNNLIDSKTTNGIFNHAEWDSVHIASPTTGGSLITAGDGSFTVSGTRSNQATNTAQYGRVQVEYQLRDNSDGSIGGRTTVADIAAGPSQNWSTTVSPGACPNTAASGCDVLVRAGGFRSDQNTLIGGDAIQVRGHSYTQVASSAQVTPSAQTLPTDTTAYYSATALDQAGKVMRGVSLTLAKAVPAGSPNTATLSRTTGTTDFYGNVTFTMTDPNPETTTVTVTGSGSTTATLTTTGPTAGGFTALPAKALAATPYTAVGTGTGSTAPVGSEYTASTPGVRMCFTLAGGAPIDSTKPGTVARVFASSTRTTRTGAVNSTGSETAAALTQIQGTNPGCYLVARSAAGLEEQGQDVFAGYYNANGVAGYQAGSADVLAAPTTIAWGQHKLTGTPGAAQINTYGTVSFSSKTPDGQSFVGRKLTLTVTGPASSTLNPSQPAGTTYVNPTTATCLTNSTGECSVSVTDANAVTTELRASDNITDPGLNQVATGRWATAQVSFTPLPPANGTFTSTPNKALYAVPFTGTFAGTGSTDPVGSDFDANSPAARLCFNQADGSPIDSAQPFTTAKVFVSMTRTVQMGGTSSTAAAVTVPVTQVHSSNPGCYRIQPTATETLESGSDSFTGHYNADGVAGYQAGGGDISVTPMTLSWAQLKLTGSTMTTLKGRYVTAKFAAKTPGGHGFAGRKLSITVNSPATSTLNPIQPAGTTYQSPNTATCLTDASGGCSASVTDPEAALTTLTASDNLTDPSLGQIATGGWGTAQISFTATPGGLVSVGTTAVDVLQPAVNVVGGQQRPGDIGHYRYTLLDNNSSPLANQTVTLRLSEGFFTPDCASYPTCTFSPAPTDGANTGVPASLGQSISVTSDNDGQFTFATAIGRDAQLDVTGSLITTLTVLGANGAAAAELTPFTTAGTALANAGSLAVVPFGSEDALTGNVASNGTNAIAGQSGLLAAPGSTFQVRLTDGFGNLATLRSCAVQVAVTAGSAQTGGSAAYLDGPGSTSQTACGSFTSTAAVHGVPVERFHLDSNDTSSTGDAVVLTASWPIPWTHYTASAGSTGGFTTTAGIATPLSASKQLTLYAIDQRALRTAMSQDPGGSAPVNTPVTVTATVTDQVGNPVVGVSVAFHRQGPDDADGAAQSGDAERPTDAAGTASLTYSSATAGTATITAVTTSSSGTELTRGVSSTTFTTDASPTPSPTPSPSASPDPEPTVTISGGDRQSPVLNTVFTITGTAPAGSTVSLRFRKAGSPAGDFSLVRTVTAAADGSWQRDITASVDYVYYATITLGTGTLIRSGSVLNQPTPIVNGPTTRSVVRNQTVTLTGQAAPLSTVFLHFRKGGDPANQYNIVRQVTVASNGQWQRALVAGVDYRFYVSRLAGDSATGRTLYLLKTR